jgi:hypothetical protein
MFDNFVSEIYGYLITLPINKKLADFFGIKNVECDCNVAVSVFQKAKKVFDDQTTKKLLSLNNDYLIHNVTNLDFVNFLKNAFFRFFSKNENAYVLWSSIDESNIQYAFFMLFKKIFENIEKDKFDNDIKIFVEARLTNPFV